MKKVNMMLDMAFTIETGREFKDLSMLDILPGILNRVVSLMQHWEPEAIGYDDEYEVNTDITAEQAEGKWVSEHPDFSLAYWRSVVRADDTLQGYWSWVAHNVNSAWVHESGLDKS